MTIGIGVVTMIVGFGNAAARALFDLRHPETRGKRGSVSRWGFVYAPIRPMLAVGVIGVAVLIVGVVV